MNRTLFLTFDCEDFINTRSIKALYLILKLLQKHNFKAIFFITGHMAEKISSFPEILHLLKNHEIGYHSTSHTVRPTIVEYTDVENYEEAYMISLRRETSHVNPLTGAVEETGGIEFLRDLFPKKKIVSFRAPGLCWSPPHLEALRSLGISFDFSACISSTPVYYKSITFYPDAVFIDKFNRLEYRCLFGSILRNRTTVLGLHPNLFVNQNNWDSIYYDGNPKELFEVRPKSRKDAQALMQRLDHFLTYLHFLEKSRIVRVTPPPTETKHEIQIDKETAEKSYEMSVSWAKNCLNYETKFIHSHFMRFFNI
jgi:peptidoglycan/xylan/chitin deacetylase (PgdA/CDA1 family)